MILLKVLLLKFCIVFKLWKQITVLNFIHRNYAITERAKGTSLKIAYYDYFRRSEK